MSPFQYFCITDTVDLGGERRRLVSAGGRDARRIVQALGIEQPAPPGGD